MKCASRILVAIVLVLMSVTIYQQRINLDDVYARSTSLTGALSDIVFMLHEKMDLSVLDSCGIITSGYGYGSCVAIRPDLILTAGHCIDMSGAWVEIGGYQYRILSQWRSDKYDVGFITIEGNVPFVELAGRTPQLLDEVYLVGSPYYMELNESITKGIISNCNRNMFGLTGLLQTDAEGAPGSSGCPLFCLQSKIIGICVAGPNPGGGVSLCEPVSHIKEALDEYDSYVGLKRDTVVGSGEGN